jgi:YegS/Rv2252/BmrU family lipid kinase
MARKLIFLMNPLSGTRNKLNIKETLINALNEHGTPFEFIPTNAEGDYSFLEIRILEEQIRDVVIIGGDGTVSQVANSLRHLPVNFGVIPMGSGNGLALAAGIPLNPLQALEVVLNGKASRIDAFTINGHFSCMLSGIGFDAKVAHDFSKQKTRGLWTYVKLGAANFFRAKEYAFALRINGKEIETEAYFISIANGNQFGNHFTIAPKAMLGDGLLDIVVVQKMNKFQLLLSVIYQIRYGDVQEGIFKKHGILYYQVTEMELINKSLAPLHIDGDPHPTSPTFHIKVIPSALSLIQPR